MGAKVTQPRLGTGRIGCSFPQMDVLLQPHRPGSRQGAGGAGPAGDEGWGARCWDLAQQSSDFQKDKLKLWQAVPLTGSIGLYPWVPWQRMKALDPG